MDSLREKVTVICLAGVGIAMGCIAATALGAPVALAVVAFVITFGPSALLVILGSSTRDKLLSRLFSKRGFVIARIVLFGTTLICIVESVLRLPMWVVMTTAVGGIVTPFAILLYEVLADKSADRGQLSRGQS